MNLEVLGLFQARQFMDQPGHRRCEAQWSAIPPGDGESEHDESQVDCADSPPRTGAIPSGHMQESIAQQDRIERQQEQGPPGDAPVHRDEAADPVGDILTDDGAVVGEDDGTDDGMEKCHARSEEPMACHEDQAAHDPGEGEPANGAAMPGERRHQRGHAKGEDDGRGDDAEVPEESFVEVAIAHEQAWRDWLEQRGEEQAEAGDQRQQQRRQKPPRS